VAIANKLNKPLWVHGFMDDREIKTKRRASFVLDGFREFQAKCMSRNIRFTFSMSYSKNRKPHHLSLTYRACVVVTDEAFVKPHLDTMNSISKASPCLTIAVDTSCILPVYLVKKSCISRAYKFQAATGDKRKKRASVMYPKLPVLQNSFESLCPEPFLDLSKTDNEELLTRLELSDVSIISHTIGGEMNAKMRWQEFLSNGIKHYHKKRNNPLAPYGVSRMSAYLNLGMISPFTMANDVMKLTGGGVEKFIDEFFKWREMSYAVCFHNPHYMNIRRMLPSWAHATLSQHLQDPRPSFTLKQLEQSQTDSRLWNICQQSLTKNGELHNNLRMTWGKNLILWRIDGNASVQHFYNTLIYLNDTYALDGTAPPSYLGILWCLGFGDSKKSPERQCFGTVRYRTAKSVQRRYDLNKLQRLVDTFNVKKKRKTKSIFEMFSSSQRNVGGADAVNSSGRLTKKRKMAM